MSVTTGSQCILCNLPIRFDTYEGCSHNCRYCFVQRKTNISKIKAGSTVKALEHFINGERTVDTNWCDWNIPVHWGGMSDPFQPLEKNLRISYECLKLFAKTQYPFVVSTKGALVADDEYLKLLEQCNCVVQISMVCSKYDKLETGAPTYEERLAMVRKISPRVQRVVLRCQPYMLEVFEDVKKNIARAAEAGAYGIVFEGMKFVKKKPGLVKCAGDFVYPLPILKEHFSVLREECHKYGLKFYSGENRLRGMGDDMCCCGIDGLKGFKGNEYNICMMLNGKDVKPTEHMKTVGTAGCYRAIYQDSSKSRALNKMSFAGQMQKMLKEKPEYFKEVFGK